MRLIAHRLKILTEQRHRAAIELARGDDGGRSWRQRQDRDVQCGHAARRSGARLRTLEVGHRALEHRSVFVGVAAVVVAGPVPLNDSVIVGEILENMH